KEVGRDLERQKGEANSGAGLRAVGPVLPFVIGRDVPVPIELYSVVQSPSGLVLRINQRVIIEAAHEDAVVICLGEKAARSPDTFSVGKAATKIGDRSAAIARRAFVVKSLARFKPAGQPVMRRRRDAGSENRAVLGEVLRSEIDQSNTALQIADESRGDVGM